MVLVRSVPPLNVSAVLTLTIAVSWAADRFRLWYQVVVVLLELLPAARACS